MNASTGRKIRRILAHTLPEGENAAALETGSFEVAHALCRERAYILLSTPLSSDMDVLEIGAGCGTRTRFLAERVRRVVALDEDGEALRLNEFRNSRLDNIDYHAGPYADSLARLPVGQRFSLATLVDVEPTPELLSAIRPLLAEDGLLLMAFDNPDGVKHWPTSDRPPPDRSVRLDEMRSLLAATGFSVPHVAYPYPDYRFPLAIYTDASLPEQGSCFFNDFPWDRQQPAFNSTALWNRLIAEKRFPACSNSYLLHARPVSGAPEFSCLPIFSKICSIRSASLRICTSIFRQSDGSRHVEKKPLESAAAPHIASLARWDRELSEQYAGTTLRVNRGERVGEAYRLEFLDAATLNGDIVTAIRQGDTDVALSLLEKEFSLLRSVATEPFQTTPESLMHFGKSPVPEGLRCAPVTDIDMNFDNFFLTPKDCMTLVDYEFTYDFPIPVDFPIFRALHYFFKRNPWIVVRHPEFVQKAWQAAGIDRSLFKHFVRWERHFQLRVQGPHDALYYFSPFSQTGVLALLHRIFPPRVRVRVGQLLPRWLQMVCFKIMNPGAKKKPEAPSYAPLE